MSAFEHGRIEIWNQAQHPLRHSPEDIAYTNEALPGVTNLKGALDYTFTVLYPRPKDSVANVAALPAVGNILGDFRVVDDDGDGKAAGYQWQQREGDVAAKWYKIYDMDWGVDGVLSGFLQKTQDFYVYRYGYDDLNDTGAALSGDDKGQHIYGGATANGHLTLHANAGDGTGAQTGFIQFADHTRPHSDSTWDLGTNTYRWRKIWTDELTSGTLTAAGGSITDSSGAISFADENLSTTGTLASGTHTIGTLVLAAASITDTSGAISFGDENLSTTGTLASGTHTIGTLVLAAGSITDTGGTISFGDENLSTTGTLSTGNATVTRLDADNVRVDTNTISVTNLDGSLNLIANGTGVINIQSAMTTIGQTVTGTLAVTGQFNADNLRIDGNTLSTTNANGNLSIVPNGTGLIECGSGIFPGTDSSLDLGKSGNVWNKLWLDGSIGDGTTEIASSVIQSLRDINTGVSDGMTIFWQTDKWVCSVPNTEIDHGTITGLGDDDHTQYALLAGRSSGQELKGGTDSGGNLTLDSTNHATKGSILVKSNVSPNTTASFSGTWAGTDLGDSGKKFRHVYTSGEFFGMRLENLGADPSSASQNTGRLFFDTVLKKVKVDTGSAIALVGGSRSETDTSWDGSTALKNVTVSDIDATKAIWALHDNANDYERMYVSVKATSSTNVRITTNVPLPAGTYRLIGLQ